MLINVPSELYVEIRVKKHGFAMKVANIRRFHVSELFLVAQALTSDFIVPVWIIIVIALSFRSLLLFSARAV